MTKSKYFHYVVVFGVVTIIFYMIARIRQQKEHCTQTVSPADTYLTYKNNSNILHCVTGEVIGKRPLVKLVDFSKLQYNKESEDTNNRKAIFKQIFDERIWEGNKEELRRAVHLQASGNYYVVIMR